MPHGNAQRREISLSSARPAPDRDDELAAEQGVRDGAAPAAGRHPRPRRSPGSTTPWPAPRTTRRPSASARRPCSSTPSGWSPSTPPRAACASAGSTAATSTCRATSAGSGCRPRTATRSRCWSTGGRPAAQPFYTATPLHDLGVRRRRHIRTRGRTVVSIADETLDLDDPDVAAAVRPGRRVGAARRAERHAHRPDDRHRPHHPGRAGPDHPRRRTAASWSSRAGRAPARPPSPCTAPPTCSTPTASGWPAAAC